MAFAAKRKNEITDALWEIKVYLMVCAVGMVILFGVICFFLSRALSGKMKETGSRVDALAEGDLSARRIRQYCPGIRNLLQNTSQMQRNLAQVIGGVQEVSGELLNSVRQVAEGSDATTEQAGQISAGDGAAVFRSGGNGGKCAEYSVTVWMRSERRSMTSVSVPDSCRRIRKKYRTTAKGGGRHGKDHDRQQSFCGIREYHYSEDS